MNNELNKKLAEWAEFQNRLLYGQEWERPDHTRQKLNEPLPNFTESLDACFKWLIYPNQGGLNNPPSNKIINWKLSNQKPNVGTYSKPRVWLSYCTLLDKGKNIWSEWQDSYAEDNSLSLALCLAVEKLIDSEGK